MKLGHLSKFIEKDNYKIGGYHTFDSNLRPVKYLQIKNGPTNSNTNKRAPHVYRFLNIWTLTEKKLLPLLWECLIPSCPSARRMWWASLVLHGALQKCWRLQATVFSPGPLALSPPEFSSLRAGQRVPRDSTLAADYKLWDINQGGPMRAIALSF